MASSRALIPLAASCSRVDGHVAAQNKHLRAATSAAGRFEWEVITALRCFDVIMCVSVLIGIYLVGAGNELMSRERAT